MYFHICYMSTILILLVFLFTRIYIYQSIYYIFTSLLYSLQYMLCHIWYVILYMYVCCDTYGINQYTLCVYVYIHGILYFTQCMLHSLYITYAMSYDLYQYYVCTLYHMIYAYAYRIYCSIIHYICYIIHSMYILQSIVYIVCIACILEPGFYVHITWYILHCISSLDDNVC